MKTIYSPTPDEILVERAIKRLSEQEGDILTLLIDHLVNVKCSRQPIDRQKKHGEAQVKITNLDHVSMSHGKTVGTCVRLIFDGQMYACCGERADTVLSWAEETKKVPLNKKIKPFPKVHFQQVAGKVRFLNGELLAA